MDAGAAAKRLAAFPRIALGSLPTRFERLERLGKKLGISLWCKRDDQIGPAMGGNKTRCLEFIMADAQRRHARKVVTFGGLQSNHARLTAAAARRMGIEPHIIHFESRPTTYEGNQLLAGLLDAKRHFVPFGGDGGMTIEASNRLARMVSLALVGPSYFIPVGGHCTVGCLGYVAAAIEIDEQAREAGLNNVTVVTAVGSGGTMAGLLAGFRLIQSPVRVVGVDVGRLWKRFPESIAQLAGSVCTLLGEHRDFSSDEIFLFQDRYVGDKYGAPSSQGNEAICQVAMSEGIFLDPVYTGKAMAGLIDLAGKGYFPRDSNVVFLHTGGVPALFACCDIGADRAVRA